MATPAQITANRINAQHSTGPKSEQGKQASAANALRDGLTSTKIFVRPGEQPEFDRFTLALLENVKPEGELESHLFDVLLHAAWNTQRCISLEAQIQIEADWKGLPDAMLDDELARKLDRIYRYKKMHEATQRHTLAELRRLQTERVYRGQQNAPSEESVLADTRAVNKPMAKPSRSSDVKSAFAILDAITAPPRLRNKANSNTGTAYGE
jgi:hypothetical protein